MNLWALAKRVAYWTVPTGVYELILNQFQGLRKKRTQLSREDKALLDKNILLKDRHKGERCFILGAGSSIKKQDLKKLAGEYVISVSNTYVHPDFHIFKPKYHVLPAILAWHSKLYSKEKFIEWLKEMEEKTLDAEMFFHIGDRELIESNGLFRNRKIHWNEYCKWNEDFKTEIDLSCVPEIGSVSEFAITVALYLGFEKIYLLGFDHDWFNGIFVYFFDEKTQHLLQPDKSKVPFMDAEHQMRRHANIFRKYKYLYNIKKNIYNANANPNHYLDVFPKVDYDSLFGGL